ncbi:MAG TPA: glycosyltransferase [Puia sp.]
MPSTAIIIPCYNEEARLDPSGFTGFLEAHPSLTLVFVNDGSKDNTAGLIDKMKTEAPSRILALHLDRNQGKAVAVSEGISFCLSPASGTFDFIGYLDADLSVSLDEMERICRIATDSGLDYAYGSRIQKLNTTINRSFFRHIMGRIIATIVDKRFRLGIYDTQCGAKLFSTDLAKVITGKKFFTKWLFDIEISLRIRNERPGAKGDEIPLHTWNSQKGSKITLLQTPTVIRDLIRLFKNYPGKPTQK